MIPPKANAAFVAAMEDVLDLYTRPHDPARPLVCLDETSKQSLPGMSPMLSLPALVAQERGHTLTARYRRVSQNCEPGRWIKFL